MFLCNTIGVMLLIMISLFHIIGVEKENHAEIINTHIDWTDILMTKYGRDLLIHFMIYIHLAYLICIQFYSLINLNLKAQSQFQIHWRCRLSTSSLYYHFFELFIDILWIITIYLAI